MAKHVFQDRGDLIPFDGPGDYAIVITNGKIELGKKGEDIHLITLNGPEGEQLTDRIYYTEKAGWRADQLMKAVGIAPKKGQEVEVTDDQYDGGKCMVELFEETYQKDGQDKTSLKVKRYYPMPKPRATAATTLKKPSAAEDEI